MTVYVVLEHDYEGSYIRSIWSTEAQADAEAARRPHEWSVEPWDLDQSYEE